MCLARTGMAYTATSSPATRTVWTPSSPSLTTWWSQGVRMAMRGLSIFIHTGLSYAVLLFIWWEINHLVHQDLQTEIIWLNVLIPILIALVNYCPLFRFLGVIGHGEDAFPILRLVMSTTGEIVASVSHHNRLVHVVCLLRSYWSPPGWCLVAIN